MTTTIDGLIQRFRKKYETESGIHVLPIPETTLPPGKGIDIQAIPNGSFTPTELCFSAVYPMVGGEAPPGRPDPHDIVIDDIRVGTVSQYSAAGPVTLDAVSQMQMRLDMMQPGLTFTVSVRNNLSHPVIFRGGAIGHGERSYHRSLGLFSEVIADLERLKQQCVGVDADLVRRVQDLFQGLKEEQFKPMLDVLTPEQTIALLDVHKAVAELAEREQKRAPAEAFRGPHGEILSPHSGSTATPEWLAAQGVMLQEIARRNAFETIARHDIDRERRTIILPFPAQDSLAPGATTEITVMPQTLFRAERMLLSANVPKEDPSTRETGSELPLRILERILVKDIIVGGVSQFYARGGSMPITLLNNRAVRFDAVEPGLTMTIVVQNGADRPVRVHASAHGTTLY